MQLTLSRRLIVLLVAASLLILVVSPNLYGVLGIVVAMVTWLWHWHVIWQNQDDNRPNSDTPLRQTLGAANWMSIVRGLLNSILLGFAFASQIDLIWVPAILYTISALLDIFDGLVARLTKQQSLLGEMLDLEYDAVGVLIVVAVGLRMGQLPWWFVLIGLARYLYIGGIELYKRGNRPIYPTPDSHNRRVTAGLMMAYLTVILWPIVDQTSSNVAAYVFGIPFVLGFLRDWLIAIGLVSVDDPRYVRWRQLYKQLTEFMLPQIGRIAAIILIAAGFVALDFATVPTWFGIVGLIMVTLGIIARLGTVFLVVLAVLGSDGGTLPALILLVCALVILQAGLRRYSLWVPEERIFERRLG